MPVFPFFDDLAGASALVLNFILANRGQPAAHGRGKQTWPTLF